MLLTELIEDNIKEFGEYPLLYHKDKSYTNIETENTAKKVSTLIDSLGIGVGERIIVCMPNSPEVIFSYQGILRSGAIVIPVMYLLHEKEINFIAENSEAKAIVTSSFLLSKIIKSTEGLDEKPKIICIDTPTEEDLKVAEAEGVEVIEWKKSVDTIEVPNEREVDLKEDDIAVILYTSGTTGQPKGVILTHKNLYSSASNGASLREDDERGTTIGILPLAHIFGFGVMNGLFIQGSSVVILSEFDAEEVFKIIEKHKVKSFAVVPAMVYGMVYGENFDKYDLSSLEAVGSGSAALPESLRQKFMEMFKADLRDGYGLSEASPGVASQRKGIPMKEGSVGLPIPGVTIKIVDENDQEVPTGETGELIVKGDNITPGYFRNEEATKEALKNGWLYTGDIAKVDEDGHLYIVDRKKDLIIRGGFNIYPRDLEELLAKHEDVLEVAVIGVPSERMGEEILACVVKKEGSNITEQELKEYCEVHLAKYKTPRQVIFIDELPRNGVGKIMKIRLKNQYQDHKFPVR